MKERIVIFADQCKRIRTSKDLNDLYAYFERDYEQGENESDEAFLDRLPTYVFNTTKKEQERIDDLMGCIGYIAGKYDEENVARIRGKRKYILVDYADKWYEEHIGEIFDTYKDIYKFLTKHHLDILLGKLEYLENHTFIDECVISYC